MLSTEIAYIAYYFHWSYEQIMAMEHPERQHWVSEIAKINQQINNTMTMRSPNL
ncbi:MAG TPA: DUF6760 family protein [Cyanophyceae cyanobacterium]